MNWKNYLAEVLRLSKLTQVLLAQELGCSQATITDILSERTKNPGGNLALTLILIGRKLGLTDPLQETTDQQPFKEAA